MNLSEKINNDLKEAMKSKDSFRLSVIRMVKGAMQLAKPNPREELTDDDVISVISKQIKMRNDSIKEFMAAGRDDLVEQNKKEIEILNTYMPKQLSQEELIEIIDKVFEEVKPSSQKDMGLIMKNISLLVKGKADMSLVNKLVKERLDQVFLLKLYNKKVPIDVVSRSMGHSKVSTTLDIYLHQEKNTINVFSL